VQSEIRDLKTFSSGRFCAWKMSEVDESILREFMTISGSSRDSAHSYLERTNGSLSRALDNFYTEQGRIDSSTVTARPKRQKVAPTKNSGMMKEIDGFFNQYACGEDPQIDPSGITRLSLDLGIDPLDVVWLYIAYECDAQCMGFFSRPEWVKGMVALDASDVYSLRDSIPYIRTKLREDANIFREAYTFSFKFSLEPGARNLSTETAIELWKLMLPFSGWTLHSQWIEFVDEQISLHKNRAVTRDLWVQMIRFMHVFPTAVSIDAFDSVDSAWPNLIDEFCERIINKK
jgi:hypothetical protein